MKKILMVVGMVLCVGNGIYATSAQQQLPNAVSDDAELMFDEAPDALDAVTAKDCDCSPLKAFNSEQETLLQACYQTALMYLLSSYLSLKNSCESAKQYVAGLLVWTPTTTVSTSSSAMSE
jgi:hypothetical protein